MLFLTRSQNPAVLKINTRSNYQRTLQVQEEYRKVALFFRYFRPDQKPGKQSYSSYPIQAKKVRQSD